MLVFSNSVFCQYYSELFQVYYRLRVFEFNTFLRIIYPLGLSVMLFIFPYFTLYLFCFLCIRLLVCLHSFSYKSVELSFVIVESPVLFALLDSVSVSFKSPTFTIVFWSVRFVWVFLLIFSSQHITVFFFLSKRLRLLSHLFYLAH